MKRKFKLLGFKTNALLTRLAVKAQNLVNRWFDDVSFGEREDFVFRYVTKTWDVSPTGNTASIVASYPRVDGKVKMYDLDSGEFFWVPLSRLAQKRVSGRASERMYEFDAIMCDDFRCETEDFFEFLSWEDLREFDAKNGRVSHLVMNKRNAQLVALPRNVKAQMKKGMVD